MLSTARSLTISRAQVLQAWQEQLHDAVHVDQAFAHLRAVLAMRGGSGGAPSTQQVVAQVQQLVEGETRVQATHDAFASVEQELRANPQGGLQQVVRHFQDLFGVASIEGCLPMMSKVCTCPSALPANEVSHLFLRSFTDKLHLHMLHTALAIVHACPPAWDVFYEAPASLGRVCHMHRSASLAIPLA